MRGASASGGRHTATFAWPSCDLRPANLSPSARSSAGQSSCLLSSGSRVRILPGALGLTRQNVGSQEGSRGLPLIACLPRARTLGLAFGLAECGFGVLADLVCQGTLT